jgi:hypothetical protein
LAGEGFADDEGLDRAPYAGATRGWKYNHAVWPHSLAASATGIQLQHARQQGQPHAAFFPVGCRRQSPQGGRIAASDGTLDPLSALVRGQGWRSSNLRAVT